MLFVTEQFLLFFIFVFTVFWALPAAYRTAFLLVASLVFYASWSVAFTFHFVAVIVINYYVMEIWKRYRKRWLFALLQIGNVANIAFFKYYYFLADFFGMLFGIDQLRHPALVQEHRLLESEIFLPLAISFYTFQIMAYGFDIYRGTYARNHRLRDVMLFKAFFPQLIAGPIMRSKELLPQIAEYAGSSVATPSADNMKRGLWLILAGLIKKLLIADPLLVVIMPIFSSPIDALSNYPPATLWVVMFCSFIFLYSDFSAYSDLARGFGFMLGFEIPINFRAPLFSHSVSEFWRRWHLTFSFWIRDYIFIPLGGSRVVEWRIYANLILTFFIGGLWHGASYSFALWGLLIGASISLESFLERRNIKEWPQRWSTRLLRITLSWMVMMIGAALFFAPSPERLGSTDSLDTLRWCVAVIGQMYNLSEFLIPDPLSLLAGGDRILSAVIGLIIFNSYEQWPDHFARLRRFENWLLPLLGLAVLIAMIEFAGGPRDFFYFQF